MMNISATFPILFEKVLENSLTKTRNILKVKIEKNRVLDVLEGKSNFEDREHYHRASY
jgi:hypothetical protein